MNYTVTQRDNLAALKKDFTQNNFFSYVKGESYDNEAWNTSIGGFAAYHNIGGLTYESAIHYPVYNLDGESLYARQAADHVFGDAFSETFYIGSDPATTFEQAYRGVVRMLRNANKHIDDTMCDDPAVDQTLDAQPFSNEVSSPSEDVVKVYIDDGEDAQAPEDYEFEQLKDKSSPEKEDGRKYSDAEPQCGYAEDTAPVNPDIKTAGETARVNIALDPNDIRIYSDPNHIIGSGYEDYCSYLNDTILQATRTKIAEGSAQELIIIQNTGTPLDMSYAFQALNDYSDKGYDIYLNREMTRLLINIH